MTTISSRDYFARIPDELPEVILKIFESREYDHSTTLSNLSNLDTSDFREIYEEIYEKSYKSIEDQFDEWFSFIELVIARAEREDNLLEALKLYEYAIEKTFFQQSDDFRIEYQAHLEMGVELVWLRLRDADIFDINQKQAIFNSFTSDGDTWDYPVLGLLMCLAWDLLPEDMDACITNYLRIRTEDLLAQSDPWAKDCQRNYQQWMYLLALVALNSSGSDEIVEIIEKTSSSSSVVEFWVAICHLARYSVAPETSVFDVWPGTSVTGWNWGELLFNTHFEWIKGNSNAVDSLLDLYQKNSDNWVWDFSFYDEIWQKSDLDQFIQLWKEKINETRNQINAK